MRAAVAGILIRGILKVTVGHAMPAGDAGCQPFLPARRIRSCLHAGRKGDRYGGARRCDQVLTRPLWLDYRGGGNEGALLHRGARKPMSPGDRGSAWYIRMCAPAGLTPCRISLRHMAVRRTAACWVARETVTRGSKPRKHGARGSSPNTGEGRSTMELIEQVGHWPGCKSPRRR